MNDIEKLKLIRAKCEECLAFYETTPRYITHYAGYMEAALDSTIAAIDLCIANLHIDPTLGLEGEICDNDGRGCRACEYTELMQRNIIKAWEGLL